LDVLFLVSAAATVVFLIASYHDIRHRSIPNSLPIAVAMVAVVKWLLISQMAAAAWAAAAAAAVFVATAILFAIGWIGGGDVKLVTAAVFLLGAPATPRFVLLMALIGGVIALLILIAHGLRRRRIGRGPDVTSVASEAPTIPYGVAIAAAAIVMMALDPRGIWPT
jgi:prepilin peptidase CpaA